MAAHKPVRIGDTVPLQQINPATETIDGKLDVSNLTQSGATSGQVPKWNGTIWAPANEAGGGGGASYTEITYAEMATAIGGATLAPGGWYLITDAAGTDLGFLTYAVTESEISVQGVGGYLNADFQAVCDYGNTPEAFQSQLGIWKSFYAVVKINYTNLSGGLFVVGDTITGSISGATAVIITDDDESGFLTCAPSSPGVIFSVLDTIDNGGGITADIGSILPVNIQQGDVVIWNLLHYQLTEAASIDGTDPETNTTAYTLLDKATYPETYVTTWDNTEFDFQNKWLQYRADAFGNKIRYSKITDDNTFLLGQSAINIFQWGRQEWYGNVVTDGKIDAINALGSIAGVIMYPESKIEGLDISNNTAIYTLLMFQSSGVTNIINQSGALNIGVNILYQYSNIANITAGAETIIESNILENGAQLTGITAGANCSISRNKIGQGATLGGTTTMGDGAQIDDNIMGPYSGITENILGDFPARISKFSLNVNSYVNNCDLSYGNVLTGGNVKTNKGLSNKTFDSGINFVNNDILLDIDQYQTISMQYEDKRVDIGVSNFSTALDITGLTTADALIENNYIGIFTLTSSNATESINQIDNAPQLFPITLRPAAGLTLTITGTAYSGISAGQIALKAASYVLDGDKGEYIILEADPLGTGALIEKQVVNGLI